MSEQVQDWESIIAHRMRPAARSADMLKVEFKRARMRAYKTTPEYRIKRKPYDIEYKRTHREELNKKSAEYRRNNPDYFRDYMMKWRKEHPNYHYKYRPGKLKMVPYTITLMGIGVMTVHVVTTSKVA